MGALVTLDLPADSPVRDLPWIITIGPLGDEEEWDPVVIGPYERPHALALAQAVVADEDLMAVVEPLLTLLGVESVRDEIEQARASVPHDLDDPSTAGGEAGGDDEPNEWAEHETRHVPPISPPTGDELRAGLARIAAGLTGR